jgi:sodium-independent sulfate anion transporter 11
VRIARTRGEFLGKVEVEPDSETSPETDDRKTSSTRDVYLSLKRNDASNKDILVESPHGGVLIYHFPEGLNYLNQAQHLKNLTDYIYTHTRRPTEDQKEEKGEALWCDTSALCKQDNDLPVLRAIVIDCSTINNIDITSVQGLVDVRNALDRWASPSTIQWHFGGLHNRWARRALAAVGFGQSSTEDGYSFGTWAIVPTMATSFGEATEGDHRRRTSTDDENTIGIRHNDLSGEKQLFPVFALDRPLFHADLGEAVRAALEYARKSECRSLSHTDSETE